MTAETVVRSQLSTVFPEQFQGATVIVLTPAGKDLAWAAEAAWAIARAVARRDRRVALVDLSLTERALEPGTSQESEREPQNEEGIVEAFLHGVSLQQVVRQMDVPGLFFIGVGAEPHNLVEIWSSQRWDRITRGFAEEGALLLLFVPPKALQHLRPHPDRLITLGTITDLEVSSATGRVASSGVGVTHLIPDPPAQEISPASVALWSSHIAKHRRGRSRVKRTAIMGLVLATLVAVGFFLRRARPVQPPEPAPAADTMTSAPQTTAPVPTPPATQPVATRSGSADDTLFYSVQVASFKTQTRAIEHARAYETRGWPTTLTPVRLGLQGVWYRVMVGAFGSPVAADTALRRFYRLELLDRPNGTILRTPHMISLDLHSDSASGAAEVARLRAAEIPAYIVRSSDGYRVVVGAFETPEQASLMDSIISSGGIRGTLSSRVGRRR